MITMSHFIPLIGPYILSEKRLKDKHNIDIQHNGIFSLKEFSNNEQHIKINNSKLDITYFDIELNREHLLNPYSSNISSWISLVEQYKVPKSNIITSVPPCAGLSLLNSCSDSNNGKARGSDADQNKYIYSAVKFYLATDSDVLVLENAPALVGDKGWPILKQIKKIIKDNNLNRKLQLVKTTTLNHGLPQHRQRSFLIIHKNESYIRLNNKIHEDILLEDFLIKQQETIMFNDVDNIALVSENTYNTIWNTFVNDNYWIIEEIENLIKDKDKITFSMWPYLIDHIIPNSPTILDKYPLLKKDYEYKLKKLEIGKGYWDASPLIAKGKVNAVISKNAFKTLNPLNKKTFLTIRQMMQLMGLPNDFVLQNPIKNFNHICQNVPLNTATDSVLWAIECLENKNKLLIKDDILCVIQNNMKKNLENEILFHDYESLKQYKMTEPFKEDIFTLIQKEAI